MPFNWLPIFFNRKNNPPPDTPAPVPIAMCCPECGVPMKRSDRKEDWHVDPTGFAQYSCVNEECVLKPRYRRVDVLEVAQKAQDRSREEKRAQEHQAFEEINEVQNRMTIWLRERYPGYFRGQFQDLAEIVKYIVSKGKEGEVTRPLTAPRPTSVPRANDSEETGESYD